MGDIPTSTYCKFTFLVLNISKKEPKFPFNMFEQDTICAVATAPGGAIGIVRISGPDAIAVADKVFRGRIALSDVRSHTLHFGRVVMPDGSTLDEVLASVFRAPASYTGEDAVEFSCHGSSYILQELCRLLVRHGCRGAEPGEFTRRAFLNHRLDLAQAEAVADVIASDSVASHRLAMRQMRGQYSSAIKALRHQLQEFAALLELELDFSDHEDLEFVDRSVLAERCCQLEEAVSRLVSSFTLGNAIKRGIAVVLIGAPNVGKSTLLNALVHEDRAIVSEVQGTTRDTVEATFTISSHTFRFIDTAGLRCTHDAVEQMGMARSLKAAREAQIVLLLSDGKSPFPHFDPAEGQTLIRVFTKKDIAHPHATSSKVLETAPGLCISALTGEGMEELEVQLARVADSFYASNASDVIVTNTRHYHALLSAKESLQRVFEGLRQDIPTEFIAQDLRQCLSALAGIWGGEIIADSILDTVFSRFCIGK